MSFLVLLVLVIVQLLSPVQLFATPWTVGCQASLSFIISWSLLKRTSITLVIPGNHFILCCPLLLPPSIFPNIRVFSSELALCIRWSYIGASASVSLLQWIIRVCLLYNWLVWSPCCPGDSQESSSGPQFKASVLRHSGFYMVQLSHLYTATEKTIDLTIQTFVSKMMFLLFNTLSRFVIAFLPRSKCF